MTPHDRLEKMGLTLPPPPKPAGAYVPAVRTGNLIYVAGQLPFVDGELKYIGKIGAELTLEQGYEAARICALNALSIIHAEVGTLDRISQMVRLAGFVSSAGGFTDQPQVVNGASEFLAEIFEDRGRHARIALGVAELPLGAAVELELLAEID